MNELLSKLKSQHFTFANQTILLHPNKEDNSNIEVYWAWRKVINFLRNIMRNRYNKTVKLNFTNTMDLLCLPFSNNPVLICQNKCLYQFSKNDCIHIIKHALLDSDGTKPDPSIPANPYNRLPFSKGQLYHIYDNIYQEKHIPVIIHMFKEANFDITLFTNTHIKYLIDKSIHKYLKVHITKEEMLDDIKVIFKQYFAYLPKTIVKLNYNYLKTLLKDELLEIFNDLLVLWLKNYEYDHMDLIMNDEIVNMYSIIKKEVEFISNKYSQIFIHKRKLIIKSKKKLFKPTK